MMSIRCLTAAALVLVLAGPAFAQNAAPVATIAPGVVSGGRNFIHTVADVEKTVAFYRDVFGLELARELGKPATSERVGKLTNTVGSQFRAAVMKIPGSDIGFEFTEFTGIDRKAGTSGMRDPGSSMINFGVRDIDATIARAKKAGATVITLGGEPLERKNATTGASNRALFMKDIDGFVFEMEQFYPERETTVPAGSQVFSAAINMSTSDAERLAAFWKPFGVEVRPGKRNPAGNSTSMQLSDTVNATFRGNPILIPDSTFRWNAFEFTDIPNQPYRGRVQDPGTPAISLSVRDMEEAMKVLKASGAQIVSVGGTYVPRADGKPGGNVFFRDPDGFLYEFIQ
jgi:catechol 2,3-dioxygenase-like lactoylglutathione lyase family enzyme